MSMNVDSNVPLDIQDPVPPSSPSPQKSRSPFLPKFFSKIVLVLGVLLIIGVAAIGITYAQSKAGKNSSDTLSQSQVGQSLAAADLAKPAKNGAVNEAASNSNVSKDCGSIVLEHVFNWGVTRDITSLTAQDHLSAACMTDALLECKPAHQIGILASEKGTFNLRDEIFGIQGNSCRIHSEQASNIGFQLCMVPVSLLSTWKLQITSPDYVRREQKDSVDYFYNTAFFAKISDKPTICTTTGPIPY